MIMNYEFMIYTDQFKSNKHSKSTILADLRYTLSSWCRCCTIIISDYITELLTTINLVKQAGRTEPPQAKIEDIHSKVPPFHLGVGPAIW